MQLLKSILITGLIGTCGLAVQPGYAQLITQAPPPPVPIADEPETSETDLSLDAPQPTPATITEIESPQSQDPGDAATVDEPLEISDVPPPIAPTQPVPTETDSSTPSPVDPPTTPDTPSLPNPDVPTAPSPGQDVEPTPTSSSLSVSPSTPRTFEFQGEDVPTVLRLLARQAGINLVVSEMVQGVITMRLQDVTALQAIDVIVTSKGLAMDLIENVYYVKTAGEKAAEPTESQSYTFSFARAEAVAPLLASQLQSKSSAPQVDPRTNTIFYREAKSNVDAIRNFLAQVDKPTKQVMVEARLVETSANPRQAYGINWGGVVGSADSPQTFRYGGSNPDSLEFNNGNPQLDDFVRNASSSLTPFLGQVSILSVPQMSVTLQLLNEDSDAEFLANPRIVTADNQEATIQIVTNRPVPSLNFNEQTATAEFGGFDNYTFGSTLVVRPSVNKNNFITMSVRPEISNSNQDVNFQFGGANVSAPIIDTRTLESNVLIKSGFTLAIGGLLQDQTTKERTKVPVAGDIPILGYLFQQTTNSRSKRNLLIFVTPTVIDSETGTGLEDQVYGLRYSGEEFADPNGWLNNAKGVYRLVPTEDRSIASEYPVPGVPQPPRFQQTATPRE